mgnify:CR=1 FL=1
MQIDPGRFTGGIAILSWNVNGLGNKLKRWVVTQYFYRHNPDIVLLQETHLVGNRCGFLGRGRYKVLAHYGLTSGSRGVGILTWTSLYLKVTKTWTDLGGLYTAVMGEWQEEKITVASWYLPPGL